MTARTLAIVPRSLASAEKTRAVKHRDLPGSGDLDLPAEMPRLSVAVNSKNPENGEKMGVASDAEFMHDGTAAWKIWCTTVGERNPGEHDGRTVHFALHNSPSGQETVDNGEQLLRVAHRQERLESKRWCSAM